MEVAGAGAVVTGGASGLGRAVAESLHARGAGVAIVDLPESRGAEAAAALGDRALFAPADVTSAEQTAAAVDAAVAAFAGVRVAVNCAGVAWPGRVLTRQGEPAPLARFEDVVRINLIGTFNVARLTAAAMARLEPLGEERGVIVNTASVAAYEGQIGQAAYAASKGGVAALTLPLARDLAGRLVRCVAVAPGVFDTAMMAGLGEYGSRALAEAVPHPRRLGRPEEFAALVCHIVENPMINGEVIRLDGALRMPPR